MSNEQIITSLFKDIFNYDTHQVTNKAPSHLFDDEFVEDVRRNGLTWERLTKIADKTKIFIYETGITIHGVISEKQLKPIEKIDGYKSCFRNKNGTLAIKYNAIDVKNKKSMDDILRTIKSNFRIKVPKLVHNSKGICFLAQFEEGESMKKLFDKIDTSLFLGEKYSFIGPREKYGISNYCVHIDLKLMNPARMWDIITNWTGITLEKYLESIEIKRLERIAYDNQISQARIQRNKANEAVVIKEEKKEEVKPVQQPTKVQEIELLTYNDKSIAMFGNTARYDKLLEKLGGRPNDNLTHPATRKKTPGWIFPMFRKQTIENTFKSLQVVITPFALAMRA